MTEIASDHETGGQHREAPVGRIGRPLWAGVDRSPRTPTSTDLLDEQRSNNPRLALGLVSFVLAVFASAVSAGLLYLVTPAPASS